MLVACGRSSRSVPHQIRQSSITVAPCCGPRRPRMPQRIAHDTLSIFVRLQSDLVAQSPHATSQCIGRPGLPLAIEIYEIGRGRRLSLLEPIELANDTGFERDSSNVVVRPPQTFSLELS